MNRPLTLLILIPIILLIFLFVALEEEGIYACYMDNGDMEYCKDREKVFVYRECVSSASKDLAEGDDAIARDWCSKIFEAEATK